MTNGGIEPRTEFWNNDATFRSVCDQVLLRDCGKLDKLLGRAVEEEVITVVSSGSALPIIDLTKVPWPFSS